MEDALIIKYFVVVLQNEIFFKNAKKYLAFFPELC